MPTPLEALQGVPNAYQALPRLLTGGQPGESHFRALRAAGLEVVIDTRHPMEPRPVDQTALMAELGFEYYVVPVTDVTLTDETLDRITQLLRDNANRETLVHCQSGNRVGGALIPYLVLDQDMSEADAVTAAMRMGLRGAHLMEWGMQYARAKQP
jgi:protein tyrosine phosphatase (PTP) superfamily phosphohydrolase (DUF442 family)